MILGSIVILFILTHCYRMALKIYELSSPNAHTIEKFKTCYSLKRYDTIVYSTRYYKNSILNLVCNKMLNHHKFSFQAPCTSNILHVIPPEQSFYSGKFVYKLYHLLFRWNRISDPNKRPFRRNERILSIVI